MKHNICILGASVRTGQLLFGVDVAPKVVDLFLQNKVEQIEIPKNKEPNYILYSTIKSIDDYCVLIGGDHSVAIGSIYASMHKHKDLGVIWVDAHPDIHTPLTSESGNLHGQPVSFLMQLNGIESNQSNLDWVMHLPPLNPAKLVYIGLRSIDTAEQKHLEDLNILYFTMTDIQQLGIEKVMNSALKHLNGCPIHVSFDIDSIDPKFAPHTGTPVLNGLNPHQVRYICKSLKDKLVSMDLVEINPYVNMDKNTHSTAKFGAQIIKWCWDIEGKL